MRVCLALLGAAAVSCAVARVPASTFARGRVLALAIPAPSLHEAARSVLVYLPPSYDKSWALARRYPVVMFLHGGPGSNVDWMRRAHIDRLLDSLIAARAIPEIIALMPAANGLGPHERSLYLNTYDGKQRMEDFITVDVIDWADRHLRTFPKPAQRALLGISDGASAAINLAFKHPDRFGACAGHSGTYELGHLPPMPRVLGPEPDASRLLVANSPRRYLEHTAPRLRGLVVYFDAGVFDGDLMDNLDFHRELTMLHVPHTFRMYAGIHDWSSWNSRFALSLPIVTRNMQ